MPYLVYLIRALPFLSIALGLFTTARASVKPFPAGIVNLSSNQITANNTSAYLARHPWSNGNVQGMRMKAAWSYVQPTSTTCDWSGLDQALQLGAQSRKFIGLSVTAGTFSPQWVYDAGARKYTLQDGSGLSMPLPWDAAFLDKWLSFIRALGQRYDGNPALGYVVMSGLGQQNETYVAQTAADDTSLTALGGASAWVSAAKMIISTYAQAFPTTPFFLTMARPFPSTRVGVAALQEVVDWGIATYPGRFGLMTASLHATSSMGYYPNEAIFNAQSQQPTGFQMLCVSSDGARMGGTLAQALTVGAQLGGRFVEVYEPDVENPAQQSTLAAAFQFDFSGDILWQNNLTGKRAVWLMTDTRRVGLVDLGVIPTFWNIAATGDFNGNGKPDIVWQNSSTGECAIWFANGVRASTGTNFATVNPAWKIVGAADLNGDGHSDILWQNTTTGACVIWLMNGIHPVATTSLGTESTSWTMVGTGDFNGDSKPDIIWQNSVTGCCVVWMMNDTRYAGLSVIGIVDPSWKIVGVSDFNGDGKCDILWQNSVSGGCGIWLMNGMRRIGVVSLGSVPNTWEIRNH